MWHHRASRGLTLFEASGTDEGDRTWQIFNHILDENYGDGYISKDFHNVQQTAGGLPPHLTYEQFLGMIIGHVRADLEGSSFGDDVDDNSFMQAALTFDAMIRQHIVFLNGVVHQAAPGEVHVALWNLILESRADDSSIYSCYRDYLVNA